MAPWFLEGLPFLHTYWKHTYKAIVLLLVFSMLSILACAVLLKWHGLLQEENLRWLSYQVEAESLEKLLENRQADMLHTLVSEASDSARPSVLKDQIMQTIALSGVSLLSLETNRDHRISFSVQGGFDKVLACMVSLKESFPYHQVEIDKITGQDGLVFLQGAVVITQAKPAIGTER